VSYLLNLSILIVIMYRIFIGMKGKLFNESINFVNFLFSASMSFTLFRTVGPYVYKYIYPDEAYALFIAFWVLFILFMSIVWAIKQFLISKIHSTTKEKTISFHASIDKAGGAFFGLLLGINLVGYIIISLYIAPATNNLYNLREEGKIIFKADERWVKTYSWFTKFDWREFLDTLKPEEPPTEEEKESSKKSSYRKGMNRE
jgi:uncharacterized membrane protein required for colicin V production